MKLSLCCANFIKKYRISIPLRKCNGPSKDSVFYRTNSHILNRKFYSFAFCNFKCFVGNSFHTASPLKAKSFQEKENEYAHSIMENLPSYHSSVVRSLVPSGSSSSNATSEVVKEFAQVTLRAQAQNINLENSMFSHLVVNLSQTLPKLSNEDLVNVLHHLCLWPPSPKSYSANFKHIWNTLDLECVQRLKTWDTNLKLLVADYWFCLRLSRISQYNKNLISDLIDNLDGLDDHQVVQLMFYINLQRQVSQSHQRVLQKRLPTVVRSVSMEEIGVVCLGFFKTESAVDDFGVIKCIMERLSAEIGRVNTVTAVAVLKFLKKTMHLDRTEAYVPLLHKCVSCVERWDVPTSIHSALLSAECHVYHPLLLDTVTRKVASNMDISRLKDCLKLLQCLSHFNHYVESDFHRLFLAEIKGDWRVAELRSFHRNIVYTALFYAYLKCYDYELLSTVLAPQFVADCLKIHPEMKHALAEIDYCVGIECKDYVGPRLEADHLKCLASRRGNLPADSPNPNMQTRITTEIIQILDSMLIDKRNILVKHILPHFFSPDIIVRLSGGTTPLSDLCSDVTPETVLVPPKNETWACVVVTSTFSFAYKSKHLTGVIAMKLRQLEALGYKIVFVPFYEIPTNVALRKKYMSKKLELEIGKSPKVSVM